MEKQAEVKAEATGPTKGMELLSPPCPPNGTATTTPPQPTETTSPPQLLSLLLDFCLPSSAYATMLIRELTREGTSRGRQAALTTQALAAAGIAANAAGADNAGATTAAADAV
jgi:tRNA(Glu) U13 pseudouridine synthase TruD